jgi:curved DNA-binding protein CbpA
MSFRPPPILRFTVPLRAASIWTCHSCLSRTTRPTRHASRPPTSFFHSTARYQSDSAQNHYEALQLPQSASAGDIKRQFYTLSKKHHPDRNPNDPTASTRFVAISEAYHTLSIPEKRAQYDAQITQSTGSRWGRAAGQPAPQGSYSSAGFAGSRPASGLNKKRSTFRGPPPSFYKAGGYGRHGAKRAEYAHHEHEGEEKGEESAGAGSYGGYAGFGPGQTRQGDDVPHFDDIRHKETLENVSEHIQSRRRKARREVEEEIDKGNMLVNFLMVSGVVGVIGLTAKVFGDLEHEKHEKKR